MDLLSELRALVRKATPDPAPIQIQKVAAEEQRIIGVVLEPEVNDLHNDIYSADEIRKAQESFNEHCMTPNLQHIANVGADSIVIEKSFILDVDAVIGDRPVKSGTWVQQWKINDSDLWDLCKDGSFTGFSVGCGGLFEDIE